MRAYFTENYGLDVFRCVFELNRVVGGIGEISWMGNGRRLVTRLKDGLGKDIYFDNGGQVVPVRFSLGVHASVWPRVEMIYFPGRGLSSSSEVTALLSPYRGRRIRDKEDFDIKIPGGVLEMRFEGS
jgi:hypothetical protein